jgi:hypothetical protein
MDIATEYCIVIGDDGTQRKMRAPEWWRRAQYAKYPDDYVPVYEGRPPWDTNAAERRKLSRMFGALAVPPEERHELKAQKAYWDSYKIYWKYRND